MPNPRRLAAATIALVALTGTFVLAGSFAAQADDGLEHDRPDTATMSWSDAQSGVIFSGTSTHPVDVDVYVDGEDLVCTSVVVAGVWSCEATFPLPVGTHTYTAWQVTDPGPPPVDAFDDVDITVELPTPVVSGPATVLPGGTIALTGTGGVAGGTLTAEVTDPVGTGLSCIAGPLAADGPWGCDIPFDAELDPGSTATITVTQTFPGSTPTSTTHAVQVLSGEFRVISPAQDAVVTWSSAPDYFVVSGETPDAEPIEVFLDGSAVPSCVIPAPGVTWSCPGFQPSPGAHVLTARQGTNEDQVVDFEVLLPAPGVDGAPFEVGEGDDLVFSGTQSYPGTDTRVTVYFEAEGAPFGEAMAPVDCTAGSGFWSCSIPQSLDAGSYLVTFEHVLPGDPTVSGAISGPTALDILPPPAGPRLNCTFSPNGGVRSSSGVTLEYQDVYRIAPTSGGGSSSGGSGGGEPAPQGYCNDDPGLPYPATYSYELVTECGQVCDIASLPPGDYEIYHAVSDGVGGYSYEGHSYKFRIPPAATISTVASVSNSVLLRGAGTAGDTLRVERSNGTSLCTTTVAANGTWACTFGKSSAARARVIDIDAASGGMSAYSAYRAIPVYEAPAADAPLAVVTWFLEFGGDLMNLRPGDSFTLNVSGMPEGTAIEVWMYSTPRLLGTATGTGQPMTMELTVPDDIENGAHEIEMTATTPLGTTYFFRSDAQVSGGVDPEALPTEAVDEEAPEGAGGTGGAGDRSDPAAPSALTASIAPLDRIVANPVTVAIAGGLALALLFLVALPTELLNSSLSSNTSRLGRVYGAIDGAMTKAQDWFIRVTRSRALAAGLLTTIVAIIYGFVDPGFGFDPVSLRLVLSLGIAFFLLTFVASWLSGLIIRRLWGLSGVVALQPSVILFAVVGVVVARILDFSPGFLVGVAIGLELIAASRRMSARAVLVQFLVIVGLSLAAWMVYSLFTPGADFAGMLVEDTLVAVTAEGLTGALIAIFPLQFMDGRELWLASKRLWVGAFLLVAVPFALLVLPTAVEGTEVGDYGVWLLVFAVFGLVSIAIWLVFARAARREEAAAERVEA